MAQTSIAKGKNCAPGPRSYTGLPLWMRYHPPPHNHPHPPCVNRPPITTVFPWLEGKQTIVRQTDSNKENDAG